MTILELMRVRDRAELRVAEGDNISIFNVRVQDITPKGIVIDRPIIDRRLFPETVGRQVELQYRRWDSMYRFSTRVLEESTFEGLPVLLLELPQEIERIRRRQRREHLRLSVPSRIIFHRTTGPEGKIIGDFRRGVVLDVSAGGVKFSIANSQAYNIRPGDIIQITFTLTKEISVLEQLAQVLKLGPAPRDPTRTWIVCRYQSLSATLQEAIIVHNIRYQQRYRIEKKGKADDRKGG